MRALPPSGRSRVESRRTSVDLPDPFWPRIATHSPRSIEKLTPSRAATRRLRLRRPERSASRRKNSLRRLSTSTANMLLSRRIGGTRTRRTAQAVRAETGVSRRAAFAATIPVGARRHKSLGRGTPDVSAAPTSLKAAMTFDETWDDSRRPRLTGAPFVAAVAGALAGCRDAGSTYLITADHVVKDSSASVTLSRSSQSWQGEVTAQDAKNDLAVIRLDAQPLGADPLWQKPRSGVPAVGDELLLAGSPFGLSGTVTTGVVSRVTPKLVQTDAAANPGHSGGPAVAKDGRIVGVLVAGGGENINFAVRIDRACAKLRAC